MSFRGFSEPRQGGRGRGQRGDGNRGSFGRRRDPSNQRGRGGGGPLQPDKRNVCPPDYIFRLDEPAVPSKEVNDRENENVSTLSLASANVTDGQLPLRPEYAQFGESITLRANYFELAMPYASTRPIYKYCIEIVQNKKPDEDEPLAAKTSQRKDADDVPSYRKQRRIIKLMIEREFFKDYRPGVATDYKKALFTARKLDFSGADSKVIHVTYSDAIGVTPWRRVTAHDVKISSEEIVPIEELIQYLQAWSAPQHFAEKLPIVEALNAVIAQTPSTAKGVVSGAQNTKFYPEDGECVLLSAGIIALKGFYTSLRTSTMRLLVNVNVATSAFYDHRVQLSEIMDRFQKEAHTQNRSVWLPQLESFLKKVRVKTEYQELDGVNLLKTHTIQGFANERNNPVWGSARELSFELSKNGRSRSITVERYFLERYNRRLASWWLPCINTSTNPDKPRYIPPELCQVLPGQPCGKKLSLEQTGKMVRFAAKRPAENARKIIEGASEVIRTCRDNSILKAFGMEVEPKMITVPARVLTAPVVQYQNRNQSPAFGAWNMKGSAFKRVVPLKNWSILKVFVDPPGRPDHALTVTDNVIENFRTTLKDCGLGREPPDPVKGFQVRLSGTPSTDQNKFNDSKLRDTLKAIAEARKVKVLLVILPKKDQFIYSRIKYWADVQEGLHTVCATAEKFAHKGGQVDTFANIAHKFNLKLGGINQALSPDKLGILRSPNAMLVGIDVTHPSPANIKNTPSIAAVVASIDSNYSQFPCSLRAQKSKEEMVQDLGEMMRERLVLWAKRNGRYPEQILVYRDGVSESQYSKVLSEEFASMKRSYERLYRPGEWPKTAIIVVGKRHHTRFYPTSTQTKNPPCTDANGNPPNGTVVDRAVTDSRGWDFFMQAHKCLQGTAKPAHYVVVLNEFGEDLGPDMLEQLTHNLCYLFGRATKAVSVCPPAYYADLAAERGRCYLQMHCNINEGSRSREYESTPSSWTGGVHKEICDSMFYL